jgi:hypothetical protein
MKNRYLLIVLIGVIGLFSAYFFTQNKSEDLKYMPREQEQQANLEMIHGAMEWVNQRLVNADGIIDPAEVALARKQVELFRQQKAGNMNWTEMGPDNQGGRTRAILIDKDNHSTIYAGAVSGGLWKSTTGGQSWIKINDMQDNIAISCIAQDPVSGAIYVGTGEGFAPGSGTANGSTGFIGGGVWKSTDGTNFIVLPSTIPTDNVTNDTWSYTYEMFCDASGGIYVATQRGLQYSSNGGSTWTNPVIYPSSNPFAQPANDIEIASDGTVFAVVGNKIFISADGSVGSFSLSSNGLPASAGRIELAVAPSDPNYVYANVAKSFPNLGAFDGIYKSTDKGSSWTQIATGGSQNFDVFGGNNQGRYDNEIAVFPNNKEKIIIGGIDMYMGEAVGTSTSYAWTQKSLWALDPTSSLYLHADQHKYVFHPTNPDKIYFGTDGGISISLDGGHTFQVYNRNYNTLQLYSLAVSMNGMMMGGTQDNGTQLIPLTGNTTMSAYKVSGGDGGWCAFSYLNPNILFSTVYYASLYRSPDLGANLSDFYSDALVDITGESGDAAFVPPIFLWESINDTTTSDYVSFVAEQNYNAGDYITVNSKTASYPILHQLSSALNSGDSISIKDVVQSKFYVGLNNSIWMTRKSLDFSVPQPEWYRISSNGVSLPDGFTGTAQCMNVSSCGNYLYVGTTSGRVYRIANLLNANDYQSADNRSPYCVVETKLIKSYSSRSVTSIAVNPKDADHIIVTLGNYGNTTYIEECKNATDQTPTFSSKQGNLPAMPVYSSLIEMNDANKVIIGTEYGVFSTDNISAGSPSWAAENANGLANVPVYALAQQTKDWTGVKNWGSIYAATHGRGFFKSDDYLSIPSDEKPSIAINSTLNIYPNPAVTETKVAYQLYETSDVVISVYNLQGKLVFKDSYANQRAGKHSLKLDCNGFSRGTYIVQVSTTKQKANGKFIVL